MGRIKRGLDAENAQPMTAGIGLFLDSWNNLAVLSFVIFDILTQNLFDKAVNGSIVLIGKSFEFAIEGWGKPYPRLDFLSRHLITTKY